MRVGLATVDFEALFIEGPAGQYSVEAKVMDVLRVLVDNADQVVLRENLIDQVWGVGYGGDERLSRAISLIRKSLGDTRGNHCYIQTIPRRGYKFIAKIDPVVEEVPEKPIEQSVEKAVKQISSPVIENPVAIEAVSSTQSSKPNPKQPSGKNWRTPAMVVALLLISAFIWMNPFKQNASPQYRVETGLEHVKNFTQKDAIPNAQEIFSGILADDPDHAAARAGLALSLIREYTHLERDPALLRRAKSSAEASLRIDNHLALANISVGWSAEFEGDFEKAHQLYDRADILDPENELTLEGQIRTYNKQGRYSEVRQSLDRALLLYPESALFHLYYGELLTKENSFVKAEAMFRKAISLSNENTRAYAQLAQSLHLQDKTSDGIQVLQDGLELNESALLYNNLGTYLFFQGQYTMAAQAFERTLKFKGNSHNYLYWANMADAARQVPSQKTKANDAYDRALQLLGEELKSNPKHPILNSRAALYYAKRGHYQKSRQFLSRVSFDQKSSATEYYRGVVTYEILAEREQALNMLKKALLAGYPLTEIKNDPELDNLRQDTEYHRIITTQGQ